MASGREPGPESGAIDHFYHVSQENCPRTKYKKLQSMYKYQRRKPGWPTCPSASSQQTSKPLQFPQCIKGDSLIRSLELIRDTPDIVLQVSFHKLRDRSWLVTQCHQLLVRAGGHRLGAEFVQVLISAYTTVIVSRERVSKEWLNALTQHLQKDVQRCQYFYGLPVLR